MLRSMAAINPKLAAGKTTSGFITDAKAALAGQAPPKNQSPFTEAKDIDHLFDLATSRLERELGDGAQRLKALKEQQAGLKAKHLSVVIDGMAALDPNLSAAITRSALHTHQAFLTEIGFEMSKFVARLRQKR
jgi:hypothetical protein